MIRRIAVFLATALIVSNLGACNLSLPGQGPGPTTWIDRPLTGDHVPLAPVTIQAHASDAEGVATIEFYVGESLLEAVEVGGKRLGDASLEWMPPAPGEYTILVRAADGQGDFGSSVSARIVVGDQPVPLGTSVLSLPTTATPTAAGGANPSSTPTADAQSSGPTFTLASNANCREGPGTAFRSLQALTQGQTATIEGRNQESDWFWIERSLSSGHCWVSASVGTANGNWQAVPVVDAPILVVTATPTPADLAPPTITDVSINPSTVQKAGCGGQETFSISATVTDASGIGNVTYEIQGPTPSDYGEAYLIPAGGDYSQSFFEAVVGPLWNAGTWSIVLHARDMANNESQAGPWTVQVLCIQ
jgi:Bacterial Ig domain